MTQSNIRNFSIIAHIDHGKSTLADRFLEITGALQAREMEAQVLDTMDLERERGITIKAHPVRLTYKADDGLTYILNLIDTPGHVDFGYEVTRSLAACEGALLLVDASQGVEAQTLANAYLAVDDSLEIIPVINKIDLPSAQPEEARRQIEEIIGLDGTTAILASAKEGLGVKEILEAIVQRLPPPEGDPDAPLKALIFDSWYDAYRGVVIVVRVLEGTIRTGTKVTADEHRAGSRGGAARRVHAQARGRRRARSRRGRLRRVRHQARGRRADRRHRHRDRAADARRRSPASRSSSRWCSPGSTRSRAIEYAELREALEKLRLNDSAFFFEPETSVALGFGFRCGFLGLLHMEIVQERLEREFDMDLVTTAPGVLYRVTTTDGAVTEIDSPAKLPEAGSIAKIEEPVITATILTPSEFVGAILQLCQDKRGVQKALEYKTSDRVLITYELPLNEVVLDFYDRLKTMSRGYASLDYHVTGYWASPLVKLDILVNGEPVDALSIIVHRDRAYDRGRMLASKMRELIPRQMFEVAIQAAIGSRIIARETRQGAAQERARQVLRRRHHPQAQAAREAEGRQEADEAGRHGRDPAGGVSRRAQSWGRIERSGVGRVRTEKPAMSRSERFRKSTVREYFESLVVAVILALFVRTFGFQAFKIPTGSMEPNLLVGDHLLVNKFIFGPSLSGIERAVLPMRHGRARRGAGLQVSRAARPRLHQAGDRAARRDVRAAEPDHVHQRRAADGAVRALPAAADPGHRQRRGRRRAAEVRPGDGSRRTTTS